MTTPDKPIAAHPDYRAVAFDAYGVLQGILGALKEANGSAITDTIWYSDAETLFDFIDSEIERFTKMSIAAKQVNEQHGDSGLTGSVPASAATTCPACGSPMRDLFNFNKGCRADGDHHPWHDTPPDSAPVAGNTGSSAPTSAAETVVKQDVLEPSAGGGDTPDLIKNLYEAIGQYSVQVATAGEMAPPEYLTQAINAIERQRDDARRELKTANRQLEIERMRLAACGVVARADAPSSATSARNIRQEYWSGSCDDVARLSDECMRLRTELADAKAAYENLRNGVLLKKLETTIADAAASVAVEQLRTELADAKEKITELEKRLACARAETVEDCYSVITLIITSTVGFPTTAWDLAREKIRALASAPTGYVCAPLKPERDRVHAGAQRLMRYQEGTTDNDFSPLQWAEAHQDAERVYLSMVNFAAARK